jgi:UDP-N-acetylglucosamine 2-epimerase
MFCENFNEKFKFYRNRIRRNSGGDKCTTHIKKDLIIRNSTERPEALYCGDAKLVPTNYSKVLEEIK